MSDLDENADDVIEGGRPPRRRLPRKLVIGFYAVCAGTALVWAVVVLADGKPATIAASTPTPTIADDVPNESRPLAPALDCRGRDRDLKVCAGLDQRVLQNAPGRHSLTVAGVSLSYSLPSTPGWENGLGWTRYGSNYMSQGLVGPQAAEAVIYLAAFPDGGWADLCAALLDLPIGTSIADLATAVSTTPGTELVSGPSQVTVGGVPAKQVVLTVRDDDAGCDPGYFYSWHYVAGGPFWPTTDVDDTIRVWLLDVDGTRLFIAGETKMNAHVTLAHEIQQIVESIRFT